MKSIFVQSRAMSLCTSRRSNLQRVHAQTPNAQTRRSLILAPPALLTGLALVGEVLPAGPAFAEEEGGSVYKDAVEGFEITVPSGWKFGEGTAAGPEEQSFLGISGDRRVLAWFADEANPARISVSLVITNVSAQFVKMGSFGGPYAFAEGVVNQLDESYRARDRRRKDEPAPALQKARLGDLDPKEIRGAYLFDYTLERPGTETRHCWQYVAMGNNGRYNRLYTLTATANEAEVGSYEKTLLAMLKSFKAKDIVA